MRSLWSKVSKALSNRRWWKLQAFWHGLLQGDQMWANLRLIVLLILVTGFFLLGSWLDGERFSWRYFVIPALGLGWALLVGARFVRDVYELEQVSLQSSSVGSSGTSPSGLKYLMAGLFGLGYPGMEIDDGRIINPGGKVSWLDTIGGPGTVFIRPGNVALFEKLRGPSQVLAEGRHFIARHERLKTIADLKDQHGNIDVLGAKTQDGINVIVRDVAFHYRLRTGPWSHELTGRAANHPYSYSTRAVVDMVYRRVHRENGLSSWHDGVRGIVAGTITDYISRHTTDQLIGLEGGEQTPRTEIYDLLNSARVRERLKEIGAELFWFDVGPFDFPDKSQGDENLQLSDVNDINLLRGYRHAKRMAYEDIGRAEAHAELLIRVIHSLDDVDMSGDPTQRLQHALVERVGRMLSMKQDKEEGRSAV